MEPAQSERDKKQEYLTTEIQKRGYNVQNFIEFMNSKRENGTDIDNWTFDELQKVTFSPFKFEFRLSATTPRSRQ